MQLYRLQKILAVCALIGLGVLAFFWWTGTHQGMDHNCISATIQNGECPNALTPQAALFHVKTLQTFTVITAQVVQLAIVLAFVVMVAAAWLMRADPNRWSVDFNRQTEPAQPLIQFRHWLSLFEHSPSLA